MSKLLQAATLAVATTFAAQADTEQEFATIEEMNKYYIPMGFNRISPTGKAEDGYCSLGENKGVYTKDVVTSKSIRCQLLFGLGKAADLPGCASWVANANKLMKKCEL